MKVLIIGTGPAGVSAALYACRSGVEVTLFGKDGGALTKAEKIENYYGLPEPISGAELVERGLQGVLRLGAQQVSEEVVSLSYETDFVVATKSGEYHGDRVLLATGANRQAPKIKGLAEREGSGVSYCAVCDGFFFRGKEVCVLGGGEYAVHEAEVLSKIVSKVTLLTNGESAPVVPTGIEVRTEPVLEVGGDGKVEYLALENGKVPAAALFVAVGVAGSTAFAAKIGAATNGNKIVVDEKMATNVPGLYAAGDCVGGIYQIAKAVHEGMVAGLEMAKA